MEDFAQKVTGGGGPPKTKKLTSSTALRGMLSEARKRARFPQHWRPIDVLRSHPRRNPQRRLRPLLRRPAQGLEDLRPALHRLGDLPPQGLTRRPQPHLRLA